MDVPEQISEEADKGAVRTLVRNLRDFLAERFSGTPVLETPGFATPQNPQGARFDQAKGMYHWVNEQGISRFTTEANTPESVLKAVHGEGEKEVEREVAS